MRSALIFLALVPLVFSYPEKRLFLDTFGLDLNVIKATVQHILDTLGTDATEQQCEGVCHGFVKGDDGALLHTFCTPVCRSVQSLTHVFHLTPSVTSAPARRSIFDQLVDIQAVKDTVAKLADTLGTDATEQQCEASCHAIVLGEETALAHTLCTPVCKSFQALSHHFGHHQAKRFFLDSIGLDLGSIKSTVQHLVDTLGTDATEQQCEGVCHGFVRGDDGALLHTFCTPVCRSVQSLTHVFHLTPAVTSAPAKRSIFDQLVDIQAVKDTVAKLADTLGTDATEQQCEAGCHAIVLGEETALAHTLCSPICKSFQALSHHFGHHQAKRFFLDTFGVDLNVIKATVQHVLDTLGTDATEQQCEGVCHGFVKGDDGALLHTFCTPVCRSVQSLTHVFHLTPAVTSAPARRSIFDQLVDIQAVKDTVAKLADTLGTDATEQQCEAGCHAIVLGEETALAHTLCTPVCKSFQALSHHFGHHQAKRFFLDAIGLDLGAIKDTVQHLVDNLATDANEQQCEGVCHGFVKGDDGALLHTFCTPVCKSFQSLVHMFNISPNHIVASTAAPATV
ncbi:uncharacterized protein [Littorina saxatilis]|uniref:Uncharacterized protein n=1 Tax=Littorina saxatilis TaxID=31220 RepID=A0AAN9C2Y8_9CAEN